MALFALHILIASWRVNTGMNLSFDFLVKIHSLKTYHYKQGSTWTDVGHPPVPDFSKKYMFPVPAQLPGKICSREGVRLSSRSRQSLTTSVRDYFLLFFILSWWFPYVFRYSIHLCNFHLAINLTKVISKFIFKDFYITKSYAYFHLFDDNQ